VLLYALFAGLSVLGWRAWREIEKAQDSADRVTRDGITGRGRA
jgi:hypothetical protein